jgi:branched-chain amino acid aminotransferase
MEVLMALQTVEKIWMDGKLVNWEDAKIHILTHGLHYGSGVFEGIRAYGTKKGPAVFRLTEHIQRLFRSAKVYRMEIPFSEEELIEATKETVRVNKVTSCYIRPIVYRGYGGMGLYPMGVPVNVSIAVWPWGAYLGEEGIKHGVKVKISSFRRNDPNAIPPASKACGQYLNSILAKIEVVSAGYDEAILLNSSGSVSDGSGENVFIVKNGEVITPPTSAGALEGITRDSVINIARDLNIPVVERELVRTDLYLADEVFFTGSAAEIVPIREIDDRVIGEPGPISKQLQEVFFRTIKGKEPKYSSWLEHV